MAGWSLSRAHRLIRQDIRASEGDFGGLFLFQDFIELKPPCVKALAENTNDLDLLESQVGFVTRT
jgi:hypothetical protein